MRLTSLLLPVRMDAEQMLEQPTVHRWLFAGRDHVAQAAWAEELAGRLEAARDMA